MQIWTWIKDRVGYPVSTKRGMRAALFGLILAAMPAQSSEPLDWDQVMEAASGQKVHLYAWGGSHEANQYLKWVEKEVKQRYQIELQHVKVSDIGETVSRLLLQEANPLAEGQSPVDILWINGKNFETLSQADLLFGPFADQLPNYHLLDHENLPLADDFGLPVNGMEAAWGLGQLVLIHDAEVLPEPPKSAQEFLAFARNNPQRITYPRPPQFHGSSFLKQLMLDIHGNDPRFQQPVTPAAFNDLTEPLWAYLDSLHPMLWREGEAFPSSAAQMMQMLDDGELDLAISFNPLEAQMAALQGYLPETARSYTFAAGALTNSHYLGINKNSASQEAAMVVINFLQSAEAQARKADPELWGDPSVLAIKQLPKAEQKLFPEGFELSPGLPEPHPSWQRALEKSWQQRYANE